MPQNSSLKPLLYSYIRFSTIEQAKGQSLNRQMNYAKEVALEKGLELDDSLTMRDLGLSAFHGNNIKKGALGLFLDAIEQGRIPVGSILVIESLDRISRAAPLESQGVIAQIINADITVITAVDRKEYNKESIKQNPMDLIYIILTLIRANEESEIKSIRVRSAITKQCNDWLSGKRGFRVKCGKAPSWVKWDDDLKLFIFVPREKEIMLRKIALYKMGLGGLKIAALLNEEFGPGTVHHTGANVYKEVKRHSLHGELHVQVGATEYVLSGYYPKLLSLSDFELLLVDSSKRGAIKYTQKFVTILSGIGVFKCGCCGKSVGSHVIYRGKSLEDVPDSHKRYGCVEAKRKNNCNMKTVQAGMVENAVVLFCQDKVNLQRILLNGGDRESLNIEEVKLKHRLAEIEENINSLTNTLMLLKDEPPLAIAKKISMLESESKDISNKLVKNNNKIAKIDNSFRDEVTDRWLNLTKNLSTLNNEERLSIRLLVKDTFKSITLLVDHNPSMDLVGLDSFIVQRLMCKDHVNFFDLVLEFHNGKKRLLRLDKGSGFLLAGFELR
jgi:DNA invertase Pin-like site-specific DNA recombinase